MNKRTKKSIKKYYLCQNERPYLHLEVRARRDYLLKLQMEHRLEINLNETILLVLTTQQHGEKGLFFQQTLDFLPLLVQTSASTVGLSRLS
jgi:hypothetical protein